MKKKIFILTVFSVVFMLFTQGLYAWENQKTHPALTQRAIDSSICILDSYLKTGLGIAGGLSTELYWDFPSSVKERMEKAEPDKTTRSILDWIKAGSIIEDDPISRTRNHFHDPYRNAGLDNTEKANLLRYLFYDGDPARDWAINHSSNEFDWQAVRDDFYFALTKQTQSEREEYLASSFLRLGHVLHMLEDMGVPAHARNDSLFAHVRNEFLEKGNPLEMWVEKMIPGGGSLGRWISTGWTPTPQIYDKVSDYFDTDIYTGNYLGDGVPTPGTWGLSERTNYQFLSWTTIFNEDFLNSLYYFPNPARAYTVDVNESGRIYLAGYGVDHLARKTMSFHHLQHDHVDKAWCVLGEAIYDDYGEITLPRTINYATGLANYFFRGRLNATAQCIECGVIELTVTNQSVNSGIPQTLKGGTFELYCDDANSNRTQITDFIIDGGWTPASTLANDGTSNIKVTFVKPDTEEPTKYILVYKGNICQNPADPDADDENAIAVTTITPPSDDCCVEYSANDCCCFLDPTPAGWSSATTYVCGDCVMYNSLQYYSIYLLDNKNHLPTDTEYWSRYYPCDNEDWDSYPPFGGIGLSPEVEKYTFKNFKMQCSNWQPNHNYDIGDLCWWSDITYWPYICNSAYTSGSESQHYTKEEFDHWEPVNGVYYTDDGSDNGECYEEEFMPSVWPRDIWHKIPSPNRSFILHQTNGCNYMCGSAYPDPDKVELCVRRYNEECVLYLAYLCGIENGVKIYARAMLSHMFDYDICLFDEEFGDSQAVNGEYEDCGYESTCNIGYYQQPTVSIVPIAYPPSYSYWTLGYDYEEGDIVIGSDISKYICNVSHTSTIDNCPITGANWQDYWSLVTECL